MLLLSLTLFIVFLEGSGLDAVLLQHERHVCVCARLDPLQERNFGTLQTEQRLR